MTAAQLDILRALDELGRRSWHVPWQIVRQRLGDDAYARLTRQQHAQHVSIVDRKVRILIHNGYAEASYDKLRAGRNLIINIGPRFKITKQGRLILKECYPR